MSESNIYAYLYYVDGAVANERYQELKQGDVNFNGDGISYTLEKVSQSGQLVLVSLLGAQSIPEGVMPQLSALKPDAMLLDHYTEEGGHSSVGYISGKKKSYKDVQRHLSEKSDVIAFHLALSKKNRKKVEELIANGLKVDAIPNSGALLWQCCFQSQGPLITTLVNAGVDLNTLSPQDNPRYYDYKYSPLMEAASFKKVDVVKAMLSKGADANYIDSYRGRSALHQAIGECTHSRTICKLLLAAGADPNLPDKNGDTPFIYGCFPSDEGSGFIKTLALLEKQGADLAYVSPTSGNLAYRALYLDKFKKEDEQRRLETIQKQGIVKFLESRGIMPVAPTTRT